LEIKLSSTIEDLVKQVERLEDYEQASQALMEVVHREPATGERLALTLLRSKAGDVHLRAFAFSMLYRANRAAAFEYARENSSTCEPAVFEAILGEVADDVGLLSESSELQLMVAYLRRAISNRPDHHLEEIRRGAHEFLRVYGNESHQAM
jgi:hypothetical protein